MSGLCDGRVVIITGAGRGLGRAHALELAGHGARVVVNDLGTASDGTGSSLTPAEEVVEEIVAAGGAAIANGDDVADWDGAHRLVQSAIDNWGRLDGLVNNAGFLRDRMLATMSEQEWDEVMRVHLKGHFCPTRHAVEHWRGLAKTGADVDARIINTSSGAGLNGSVGQGNYSTMKGGIAALTLVEAAEFGRYGITANALAPSARTRMTEPVFGEAMAAPEAGFDEMDPANVSPLVAWLCSADSRDVTGRVFEVRAGLIGVYDGWRLGPTRDIGERWDAAAIGPAVRKMIAEGPEPVPVYGAQ